MPTVSKDPRGASKPIWGPVPWLTAAARQSTDLQAWYGEIHILHGVGFEIGERRDW